MNIPNSLTVMRFFLVPVFIGLFFSELDGRLIYSFTVFIIAGITDVLDGYIARKYELITTFGTVMDPLADKLMLLTVLGCYTIAKMIPPWIIIVILIKELLMIMGGLFLYFRMDKHVVPSNKYGKIATVFFYMAIVMIVFIPVKGFVIGALTIAVILKLVALIKYAIGFNTIHKMHTQ